MVFFFFTAFINLFCLYINSLFLLNWQVVYFANCVIPNSTDSNFRDLHGSNGSTCASGGSASSIGSGCKGANGSTACICGVGSAGTGGNDRNGSIAGTS